MSNPFVCGVAVVALMCPAVLPQSCQGPAQGLGFTAAEQDQVRIPDPGGAALDGFADFTIECWIKTATNGIGTLVSKWRQLTAGQTPYLMRLAGGRIQVYFTNGFAVNGAVVVNNNVWHHVAVTRTGSAGKLVIDGVLDTAFVYAPVLNSMNGPVVFGCFLNGSDNPEFGTFYDGLLDEVRIWNTGRTVAEIQSTMNQALNGTTNLVGAWNLDATVGQTVLDGSQTGAHGFLGTTPGVETSDPPWITTAGLVLGYPCAASNGNANSSLATLLVNGIGPAPTQGPFPVTLVAGGTLTFGWAGPAGMPFALLTGAYNPAVATVPGLGIIDIGTPPAFADIAFVFDGTQGPGAFLFALGPGGTATQTFTLPVSLPAGPFLAVQGIVLQPAGSTPFGFLLTAAFRLGG